MLKKIYLNWILKKEQEGVLQKASSKKIHEFDWGLEYLGLDKNASDPKSELINYTKRNLVESKNYFSPPRVGYVEFDNGNNFIRFESNIKSSFPCNNIVKAKYFPSNEKKNAIIVVPHWNADGDKYDKLCNWLRKISFSSLRLVMPYHEERDPFGPPDSTWMVSANIGLTIQAMRQCVHDIINCADWLISIGYKRIAIMGASLGSCAAFIASVHDPRIIGFFANFISSYFGDVVWTGNSTKHIRLSVEKSITQDDLRIMWLLNSPIAFIDKIEEYNPLLKQFYIIGKYDTTFRFDLSEKIINAIEKKKLAIIYKILPIGHYSLGSGIFALMDAYFFISFFNKIFTNKP